MTKIEIEALKSESYSNRALDEEWITGAARYPDGLHAVATYAFQDRLIKQIWFAR